MGFDLLFKERMILQLFAGIHNAQIAAGHVLCAVNGMLGLERWSRWLKSSGISPADFLPEVLLWFEAADDLCYLDMDAIVMVLVLLQINAANVLLLFASVRVCLCTRTRK